MKKKRKIKFVVKKRRRTINVCKKFRRNKFYYEFFFSLLIKLIMMMMQTWYAEYLYIISTRVEKFFYIVDNFIMHDCSSSIFYKFLVTLTGIYVKLCRFLSYLDAININYLIVMEILTANEHEQEDYWESQKMWWPFSNNK